LSNLTVASVASVANIFIYWQVKMLLSCFKKIKYLSTYKIRKCISCWIFILC